jgi:mRNA interferase MazF
MRRGDVVVLDFPFKDAGSKIRPALVVQNDRDNGRLSGTIVAMITGNLKHRSEPTFLFVDPTTPDGVSSKLHAPSLVNCSHLYTIDQQDVKRTIGRLSSPLIAALDDRLRVALALK